MTGRRRDKFAAYPVLQAVENTDFLQAVTMLATRKRNLADTSSKAPAISAKREDILKLTLPRIPRVGRSPTRGVHLGLDLPGGPAHLRHPVRPLSRSSSCRWRQFASCSVQMLTFMACAAKEDHPMVLVRRFSASSTAARSKRVSSAILSKSRPGRTTDPGASTPRTVQDASSVESRLHSLRTRGAAAYKGV